MTLIFDNTKVECLTISYVPCSIMISQTGPKNYMELKNGSVVRGKQIIITAKDSELIIGQDSSIWASGQSVQIYGTNKAGHGASYIGQPGYCSNSTDPSTFNTYGFFDMKPNFANLTTHTLQMGSIGKANDVETAGGGRIVLIADSITF